MPEFQGLKRYKASADVCGSKTSLTAKDFPLNIKHDDLTSCVSVQVTFEPLNFGRYVLKGLTVLSIPFLYKHNVQIQAETEAQNMCNCPNTYCLDCILVLNGKHIFRKLK